MIYKKLLSAENCSIVHSEFLTSCFLFLGCVLIVKGDYFYFFPKNLQNLSTENFPSALHSYSEYYLFPCKLIWGYQSIKTDFLMLMSGDAI